MTSRSFCLSDARILTLDDAGTTLRGCVEVRDGRIVHVGERPADPSLPAIDCTGDIVMPGFVQAHVHLCQTLFRHRAEGLPLLSWLRERIWPLEAAHDPESLELSAELGIGELLLSGTTCLLDMGTVHHEEAVIAAVQRSGIRCALGKAMMDAGEGVPPGLIESTEESLDESIRLAERWHGADEDRIRYAFAPRFVLSCTEELQREVGRLSRERGWLIHTHSSEHPEEVATVERLYGRRNIHVLHDLGLTGPRSVFAHGVHLDDGERARLRDSGTAICHCPSSNLRLGSGIADVVGLLAAGVPVALGADGAPCNNQLDPWVEMRLAHSLPALRHGPGALSADRVLRIATRGGAEALGWGARIGIVAPGRDADLIRVRTDDFRTGHAGHSAEELVAAGCRDLVRDVWVRGRRLVDDGRLTTLDRRRLLGEAPRQLRRVSERAGLA